MSSVGQSCRCLLGAVSITASLLLLATPASADTGTWSLVSSPNTSTTEDNDLFAVSCAVASDCWAVGTAFDGTGYATLAEHYVGNAWTIVNTPDAAQSGDNQLDAVSCNPDGLCWAAGWWQDSAGAVHTLVEEEAGGVWSVVASPDQSSQLPTRTADNYLNGISCVSDDDCWAVGDYLTPGTVEPVITPGIPPQTLIEHWDGNSWSIVSSPDNNSSENALDSVSCDSTSDCWAVGLYLASSATGTSAYETLVEHWDGSSWSIVPSPNVAGSTESELSAVTCSGSGCVAAGLYTMSGQPDQTLVEESNGSGWSISPSADTSTTRLNALDGVACTQTATCWAVGAYDSTGGFNYQTLIETPSTSGWGIVPSPDTASNQSNDLQGATCTQAGDCWAVGYFSNGSAKQTLIEHSASSGPPTTVPELRPLVAPALVASLGAGIVGVARRRSGRRRG